MLLLIIVIIAIVGFYFIYKFEFDSTFLETIGVLMAICGTLFSAILLIGILIVQVSAPMVRAQIDEEHKAIMYEIEVCRDDFGLLSKDVIDEIAEWNQEIIEYKYYQNNPFFGKLMYPDVYGDKDIIDYKIYTIK